MNAEPQSSPRTAELKAALSQRQAALAAVRQQKKQAEEAALAAQERAKFLKKLTSPAEWKKVGEALEANAARHNASMSMRFTGAPVANAGDLSTGSEAAISDDAMAADGTAVAIQQEVVAMSAAEIAIVNEIRALSNMLSQLGVKGGRRTRHHGKKSKKTRSKSKRGSRKN
jgi:hypothetical protein